jgi:hypothetical protein
MTASWKPNPVHVARFGRRRELYVAGLTGAMGSLPEVVCKLLDGGGTFGWSFENPASDDPFKRQGGIEFAVNYLRHMIDQGFHVAYAVSLAEDGVVHLQQWERPQVRKPWPDDTEIVFTAIWRPMRASRRSGEAR